MAKQKAAPEVEQIQPEQKQKAAPEVELPSSGVVTIEHIVDNKSIGLKKGHVVHSVSVECAKIMIKKGYAALKQNS